VVVESGDEYCRAIEAYLCRKNDGHLIRIVGPAFEQVLGWAARGVPVRIVCHGIDRYFERYYARGPRRRPVRIEFCEADVLDTFDEWRRAVGLASEATVPAASTEAGSGIVEEDQRRRQSLTAHLDRVIARLTALRAGPDRSLDESLDSAIRELDGRRQHSRTLRGDARRQFLDRLVAIDTELLEAARRTCDGATLSRLGAEAEEELAPFKGRLSAGAFAESHRAAVDRLLRERSRLPIVAFD
jgi:hypothetical protein